MGPPATENEKPVVEEDEAVIVGIAKSPAAAAAGEGCSQARPIRRCVQKKLSFFQSSGGGNGEDPEDEYDDDDDGENKRKRKGSGKGKANARAPTAGKVSAVRKENPEHESANTASFFTKVSEKRLLRRQVKKWQETTLPTSSIEQIPMQSVDGNENAMLPEGHGGSSTPCKDLTCTNTKSPGSKKKPANRKSNGAKVPPLPTSDNRQMVPEVHDGISTPCKNFTCSNSKSPGSKKKPANKNSKVAKIPSVPTSNKGPLAPEGHDGCSTPCKDLTCTDSKSPNSRKKLANRKSDVAKVPSMLSLDKEQPAPDLWLEAKAASEENIRLSAGKQIHPFFSNCKVTKRNFGTPEYAKMEMKHNLDLSKELPPIHVFDAKQSTTAIKDWSSWNVRDCSLTSLNSHTSPGTSTKSTIERCIGPLKFDTVSSVSDFCWQEQLHDKTPRSFINIDVMPTVQNTEKVFIQSPKETLSEVNLNHEANMSSQPDTSSSATPEKLQQNRTPKRLGCRQVHYGSFSDPRLWTNKYQPEKGSEVCGNAAAVKFLSEWLQSWHSGCLPTIKDKNLMFTENNDSFDSRESDAETEDDASELANVLLVTGPVGCGKSAAIYACAEEHGFEVIEVNASDHRHGSLVKQKFGEATESHGLDICAVENHAGKGKDLSFKSIASQVDKDKDDLNVDDFEVASWTSKQDFQVHGNTEETIKTSTCQVTNRSLILFEDVDTVFEEDRGFLATILQLAETSKRPIVLTANSKDPVLPHLLVRQVIDFALPSHEELLNLLSKICAAEGTHVSSTLLMRFILSCQMDIRKAILHLQFWCQGKGNAIGSARHCVYSPLQFDVDAAHMVTPQLVPWGSTCRLSEIIEQDIAKIDNLVIDTPIFMHATKNQKRKLIRNSNASNIIYSEANVSVAEKDSRGNGCVVSDTKVVCSPFKDDDTMTNISASPVKFVRRTKHRPSVVLSSESGDEGNDHHGMENRMGSLGSPTTNLSLDISMVPLSCSVECHDHDTLSNSQENDPRKLETQCPLWIPETTMSTIWGTSNSLDMSCIPESHIFAGNESNHGICFLSNMPSSGHFPPSSDDALGSNFKSLFPSSVPVEKPKLDIDNNTGNQLEDSFDDAESVHENEEIEDTDNDMELSCTTNFVDECSRADFGAFFTQVDVDESSEKAKYVQETWRRLRSCREEYRSYMSDNCKVQLQALELSSNLTSLLSDTDIMLAGCETSTSSSMDPLAPQCFESVSASWSDDQLEMASTFAQHGVCYYAIKSRNLSPQLGALCSDHLGQEMLRCNTSLMAVGKLLLQERHFVKNSSAENAHRIGESICSTSSRRDTESVARNLILPVVPERAHMTLKGYAFHEYMSSLSQISKLEKSRLSQEINGERRQRRVRQSRHYLESTFCLSSEDITQLAQQCCFKGAGCG